MMDNVTSPENQTAAAECLHLQGNDAFGTKDWKRVVELYQHSIQLTPSTKAYDILRTRVCCDTISHATATVARRV
jgi:hypothetical protein